MSPVHELLLRATPKALAALDTNSFLWRAPGEESSFHTTVGPRLEELGPVPDLHADFVRLCVLAYLVDRTAPRGRGVREGNRWERSLSLEVPVSDPTQWEPRAEALGELFAFLTGDRWDLAFRRRQQPKKRDTNKPEGEGPVLLFSGGADSLAGAITLTAALGRPPVLMSQWNWTSTGGIQREVVQQLETLWGAEAVHEQVRIGRRTNQIGSGEEFHKEDSSRSRSLLFISLGLAAAAVRQSSLVIAENGYTSLNVPLSGSRRGPLSTRTTHPAFLDKLAEILTAVGLHVQLEMPFEQLTKGEVYTEVESCIGSDQASRLLSASHSCAKPGAQYMGFSPGDQCGLCYSCLVRRAAFEASGLADTTGYVEEMLIGDSRRASWLDQGRRDDYAAVQVAARRGIRRTDIVALGLPSRVDKRAAEQLAARGLAELAALDLDLS